MIRICRKNYSETRERSTSTKAVINISSIEQVTLNIGDLKKFDITDDGFYDLSVKLNSITTPKINLTIQSIKEQIVVSSTNGTGTSDPLNQSVNGTGVLEEEGEESAAEAARVDSRRQSCLYVLRPAGP